MLASKLQLALELLASSTPDAQVTALDGQILVRADRNLHTNFLPTVLGAGFKWQPDMECWAVRT